MVNDGISLRPKTGDTQRLAAFNFQPTIADRLEQCRRRPKSAQERSGKCLIGSDLLPSRGAYGSNCCCGVASQFILCCEHMT